MRRIVPALVVAAALAAAGVVSAVAGVFELRMVTAEAHVVTQNYDEATVALDRAASLVRYTQFFAWFARPPLDDVRTRKAAVLYWQRNYSKLAASPIEPGTANVDVELLAADAKYRIGQPRMRDRQTSLDVLDGASEGYLSVLRHAGRNQRAAYNYEFVSKMKQDISKNRKGGPDVESEGPLGRLGHAVKGASSGDLEILVPLESPERDRAATAGKAAPRKRRG